MSRDLIRRVEIDVSGAPPEPGALLIAPRPFDHWGQRLRDLSVEGAAKVVEIGALNSRCRALVATPAADRAPRIGYAFAVTDTPAPDWVWDLQVNRYTTAAPGLVDLARRLAEGSTTQAEALHRLIADTADVFGYGHVETPFNAGCEAVPSVCGVATGSCVDINTYLLAAAHALGIRGQYIAGYWFHPEKTATLDMHCWLAFEPDGRLEFWDVAHGLKWAATLGARVEEGLNPAGGRRVAMSCGRGLRFETANGVVEISHFSEPVWILPNGAIQRPELHIRVADPAGLPEAEARTQFPNPERAAAPAASPTEGHPL